MILESPGSRYTSSVYSHISLLHSQIARQRIRTMVFLRRFIEAQREVEIAFQAEKYRDITGRWPVPRDSPAWGWTNSPTRMLGFPIRAGSSVVYCSGVLVTSQQMTSPPCPRPDQRLRRWSSNEPPVSCFCHRVLATASQPVRCHSVSETDWRRTRSMYYHQNTSDYRHIQFNAYLLNRLYSIRIETEDYQCTVHSLSSQKYIDPTERI